MYGSGNRHDHGTLAILDTHYLNRDPVLADTVEKARLAIPGTVGHRGVIPRAGGDRKGGRLTVARAIRDSEFARL